jgi:ubiquinone/menaquinone biosynthesis C-methylase UbiE
MHNDGNHRYLHGYSADEQRRLVEQAEYWRDRLILPGLPYVPGQRLLDVGCGAGAVLGVIGRAHPEMMLAGIDREPAQIDAARRHLATLGIAAADLRVGDAARLPWPDASFDHAFMMWFVEHVRGIEPILRDLRRVLAPGGTVTVIETEYDSFSVWPRHADWEYLMGAMYRHFELHGEPLAGKRLGPLLVAAGFSGVRNDLAGVHFFAAPGCDALRKHVDYTVGYIAPAIPEFVALGFDEARLRQGLEHLLALPDHPQGAFTHHVYRATGFA